MTIKDIAEKSGVSVSTVSRVLNDHPDVSDENRKKVLAVMKELNYVPNSAARDLVRVQSDTVGLVVRGIGNPFFTGVINVIEEAVKKADYTLVLQEIDAEADEIQTGAELANSKRLIGLIFLGGRSDYRPDQLMRIKIPFVCCTYTNSFGNLSKKQFSSVTIDDTGEAFKAVSYLVERGHERIGALLHSKTDGSISELRYVGYKKALEAAGIKYEDELVEETANFSLNATYDSTVRLIRRCPGITAIFALSDAMGMVVLKALHDEGKRVPDDCSVISIDGIELSRYSIPTLTTLKQPQRELGEKAVETLRRLIEEQGENTQITVDTSIRAGGSVKAIAL